jgi:gamma-glutamyltranspeptidase/glutathione hydrolase
MIQRFFAAIYFVTLLLIGACSPSEQVGDEGRGLIAENAMVVSAREEASKIGLSMMQQGGNAFDAMVATELALAVAYPFAGNLGVVDLWCID